MKLLEKVLIHLFSYVPLNFYSISHLPQNKIQPKCPLEIRRGCIDDIELIISSILDEDEDEDEEIICREQKYSCNESHEMFLAFSEGQPVHFARFWRYPGVLRDNPLEPLAKIERDEVFMGFCETAGRFRGENIYPAVLQYIIKDAFASGKKRCFISTATHKAASIRGIEKAGFSFMGKEQRFRIVGKTLNDRWSSSDAICSH